MPMASAACFLIRGDHGIDRLLNAEIENLIAIVRQDDVDEVFADVVDVPFDRGQDDLALFLPLRLSP